MAFWGTLDTTKISCLGSSIKLHALVSRVEWNWVHFSKEWDTFSFNQELQQVSIDELVELVTDCGVVIVDNPRLSNELKRRGFLVTEDHGKDGKFVLHKAEHKPEENDLQRTQSLVVDAYAPYSPKALLNPHPFAEDLVRHGTPLLNEISDDSSS
jgi:hypothetical protein